MSESGAHVVEPAFETSGAAIVQIGPDDMLAVMQNAGAGIAFDLSSLSWKF